MTQVPSDVFGAVAVPDEGSEAVHLPVLQRAVEWRVVPPRGCVQRGRRLCGDVVGGLSVDEEGCGEVSELWKWLEQCE